jgi:hypothetical protein
MSRTIPWPYSACRRGRSRSSSTSTRRSSTQFPRRCQRATWPRPLSFSQRLRRKRSGSWRSAAARHSFLDPRHADCRPPSAVRSSPRHLQVARAHEGPSWGAQRSRRRPPTGVSGRVIDRRSDARQPRPAAAYEAPNRPLKLSPTFPDLALPVGGLRRVIALDVADLACISDHGPPVMPPPRAIWATG